MSVTLEPPLNVHLDSPPVERWARIADAPRYFVSTNGRVMGPRGLRKPMLENGYPWFDAWVDGERRCIRVHRALALAFIPALDGKPFTNHKNGRTFDNRIDNLEWCTHQENMQHSYDELGRGGQIGETNGGHKLTENEVLEIRRLWAERSRNWNQLAEMFMVTRGCIRQVITRIHWRHLP